jgi:hypothetical protein
MDSWISSAAATPRNSATTRNAPSPPGASARTRHSARGPCRSFGGCGAARNQRSGARSDRPAVTLRSWRWPPLDNRYPPVGAGWQLRCWASETTLSWPVCSGSRRLNWPLVVQFFCDTVARGAGGPEFGSGPGCPVAEQRGEPQRAAGRVGDAPQPALCSAICPVLPRCACAGPAVCRSCTSSAAMSTLVVAGSNTSAPNRCAPAASAPLTRPAAPPRAPPRPGSWSRLLRRHRQPSPLMMAVICRSQLGSTCPWNQPRAAWNPPGPLGSISLGDAGGRGSGAGHPLQVVDPDRSRRCDAAGRVHMSERPRKSADHDRQRGTNTSAAAPGGDSAPSGMAGSFQRLAGMSGSPP